MIDKIIKIKQYRLLIEVKKIREEKVNAIKNQQYLKACTLREKEKELMQMIIIKKI